MRLWGKPKFCKPYGYDNPDDENLANKYKDVQLRVRVLYKWWGGEGISFVAERKDSAAFNLCVTRWIEERANV